MKKDNLNMQYGSLFDTPEKSREAILRLKELKNHPGWTLLTQVLEHNISMRGEEILLNDDMPPEEEKEMKQSRLIMMYFQTMPDIIMEDLDVPEEEEQPKDDVYE